MKMEVRRQGKSVQAMAETFGRIAKEMDQIVSLIRVTTSLASASNQPPDSKDLIAWMENIEHQLDCAVKDMQRFCGMIQGSGESEQAA